MFYVWKFFLSFDILGKFIQKIKHLYFEHFFCETTPTSFEK